ncbi:MAG: phosphotransferase [Pseudomonadota bacterium]
MNTIKTLVQHQLRLRNNTPVLELPVYGNVCLPVHRGYKVFNFHRKTVVRIFTPDVDQTTVEREIEGVQKASLLDFAPDIRRWNIKERWYEEEFVSGYPCCSTPKSASPMFLRIYYQHVAPRLEKMILLEAPLTTNLIEHVIHTTDILRDSKLSRPELDKTKVNLIRCFVTSMADQINGGKDYPIDLVFSHGDFSLVNILKTKDGIMVIDWEGVGRRNPLFDLYNYFFTELYYRRAEGNLVPEINEAISSLQSHLAPKAPKLAMSLLSLAETYRRLYYVERVRMLLERKPTNKLLNVILRSIDVFNRYEEMVTL